MEAKTPEGREILSRMKELRAAVGHIALDPTTAACVLMLAAECAQDTLPGECADSFAERARLVFNIVLDDLVERPPEWGSA